MENNTAPLEGSELGGTDVKSPQADINWLHYAREAHKESTDFLNENYRNQFERNIANFQGKHPPGSKYYTDAYKYRSRLFRPKTRSNLRSAEATFAEAMFATREVITLSPCDQSDKSLSDLVEPWQAVLNKRLKKDVPWFLIANAAFQESKIYGIVISRQEWETTEGNTPYEKPTITLLPIENCRFSPGADWLDPVNSSPYWIELIPMYVDDVMVRISSGEWKEYTKEEVYAAGRQTAEDENDSLRSRRDNSDPKDTDSSITGFEIVWVHRNFIKVDDNDYEFYTLSTNRMLSDPVAITPQTHPLGRNYRVGRSVIQAHKIIPQSDVEMVQDLQSEANDVANQRIDNIRLVLNKGYRVQRGSETDLGTLKRSYPGRIVLTNDVNSIAPDEISDVTSSAYAEQDRINTDIDDMTGAFSGASVASNRSLNETVGGMKMMSSAGNKVQNYTVRSFVETWVEPVLNDIVKLIMIYEHNDTIAKFFGDKMTSREQITIPMDVSVSVGFGPLDPRERARAVVESIIALGNVVPWAMGSLDLKAISREMFGVIGFRDGAKFFTQIPEGPPQQSDPKAEIMKQELEFKQQELQQRNELEMARIKSDREVKMMELALKQNMTMDQFYAKLDLDADKFNLQIMQEMGRREQIQQQREEMRLKSNIGEGI